MNNSDNNTRPSGWLGKLYDEVWPIAGKKMPAKIVEELAQTALEKKEINEKKLTVLQHRFPLYGFERKTLEQTGLILGIKYESVRQIEQVIYSKLRKILGELLKERESGTSTDNNK